jgi:hypothetical protein
MASAVGLGKGFGVFVGTSTRVGEFTTEEGEHATKTANIKMPQTCFINLILKPTCFLN